MEGQLISKDQEKLEAYFTLIEDRILKPLMKEDVQSSCTTTLLLIFSGVDSLAALQNPKERSKVTDRLKGFFDYMGDQYSKSKVDLVDLRNDLMHRAMNVESLMSHEHANSLKHLSKIKTSGILFVNTLQMRLDFESVFYKFKTEVNQNEKMFSQVVSRLKWKQIDYSASASNAKVPSPSFPPTIEIIWRKGKR